MSKRYDRIIPLYEGVFPSELALPRRALIAELARQSRGLNLIASESLITEEALAALACINHNRTIEGTVGRRWFRDTSALDELESSASGLACECFGLPNANVQPHSTTQANQAVALAVLKPGDRVLSMSLASGGHVSHGISASMLGRFYSVHNYEVDRESGRLDYDELKKTAERLQPKLLISGASAYPRQIRFAEISEIAKQVGAVHLADIAHTAGLVRAGLHPGVETADFVTMSLHKTMCGPRCGIVLSATNNRDLIDRAVFPGAQGAPMPNLLLAKYVCLQQSRQPLFQTLQTRIQGNAAALAEVLTENGIEVLTGGTDTHLILVTAPEGHDGASVEQRLFEIGILCNRNYLPHDKPSERRPSGVRFGTTWMSQLGFELDDARRLGMLVVSALRSETEVHSLRKRCIELVRDVILRNTSD